MTDFPPEKAQLLEKLSTCGFVVPDFIYVPAEDFENKNFESLETFLKRHRESFKVIARSAHPQEAFYKAGTFDSLETYADLDGIVFARRRMIRYAQVTKRLSILRQQFFEGAPPLDSEKMGVIVMPFIHGSSVMAKKLWDHWEFGYCRDRDHKVRSDPFITRTPHDRKLLDISQQIENCLGFRCEIEFIIGEDNRIFVVQAKDISKVEILEAREDKRSVRLDGLRRIRRRRNYRERSLYVMDTNALYMNLIDRCEELVLERSKLPTQIDLDRLMEEIQAYERTMENFALRNRRFAILGLSIEPSAEIYQIANHYLDDTPELQQQLTKALYNHQYFQDAFIAEADTLISKDGFHINLCGHDAYGIDTVRNPIWSVFWSAANHDHILKSLQRIGFKTGDVVGIEIGADDKPTMFRL
ncbi:hypothetical protein [Desulfosarcina sp.]|uniref:hypothetical protein n=1 Tax=Desulfosarcina sp. TaxID=2027861 RepID=UPI003970894C